MGEHLDPRERFWLVLPAGCSDGTFDAENPEGAEPFALYGDAMRHAKEIVRAYGGPDIYIYECAPAVRVFARVSAHTEGLHGTGREPEER